MPSDFNTLDIIVIGTISIVVTAVIFGFVINLLSNLNDDIQDQDLPQAGKDIMQSTSGTTPQWLDYAILGMFVALSAGCLIAGRAMGISSFAWILLFIGLITLGIFSAFLGNTYQELADNLGVNLNTLMPITSHLMNYFVVYVLVIFFASFVLSRTGESGGIQ